MSRPKSRIREGDPGFVLEVGEHYRDLIDRLGYDHPVEYECPQFVPDHDDQDAKVITFYEGMAWVDGGWWSPREFTIRDIRRSGSRADCKYENADRYLGVALDFDMCETWWEAHQEQWADRSTVGPVRVITWTLVWQQLVLGRSQQWLTEHLDALRAPETWPLRW